LNNYLLKEISDEALDLKKLIQKHKIDIVCQDIEKGVSS